MQQEDPTSFTQMPSKAQMDALTIVRLRQLSNYLSQSFSRSLADSGLNPPEWLALRLMHEAGQLPPSQLAESMATSRGATSKLTEKLVRRGLAQRVPSDGDRRGHALRLTAEGERLAIALFDLALSLDDSFFDPLGAEDRHHLHGLLSRLVRHHHRIQSA
ncbi:MarR family winged helix-turn-helix transcriptional regulator [Neotabrizicola sp. VNH66]|uniref:MarR family winged helix-turn-helix transcriptional regulator n=1 Tax=Neotabrizicola sp. VNH66 TaxID=3400918 RepID=UPI003C2BDD81